MDYRHWEHWAIVTRRLMRSCCAGAILVILASGAAAAPVPVYTVQDLGALPGGRDDSWAGGINDSGQVVGSSGDLTESRAFLWEAGIGMTDLGDLLPAGSVSSVAYAINNSGQVIVSTNTHSGELQSRSFLLNADGSVTNLGDLLPAGSVASAINDSGQVVGNTPSSTGQSHAFLLDADGSVTDLGGLSGGQDFSSAADINESGQVVGTVGEYNSPARPRTTAVLWDVNEGATNLGNLLGGDEFDSRGAGINDHGQVVGYTFSDTQPARAFLLDADGGRTDLGDDFFSASEINNNGQVVGSSTRNRAVLWEADFGMRQLDTLINPQDPLYGITLFSAGDINNSGQISATGINRDGNLRAFLLTPLQSRRSPAFLHCSRDLTPDGTVGIAVVTSDQVKIKALDGSLINQFALSGLDDLIDTELMADTNGNGAPELVALSQSSARAVVRDVLSGADLGTIEFSEGLAPFDLELGDDQTGSGIPDLAVLARNPVRVQVRDALTSGLVSDVGFTRYVTGTDLTVYPDLDGSGALSLAVLAENRQPDGADKIEIRNASSGAMIRQIWLGKGWRVLEQERIGDLNGNGSEEVAVLQQEPRYQGSVRVQIRDIETSAWVNFVGFANKYPPQSLVVIPDLDGNGADELAVFGRHLDGRNQKAVIKDARTGKQLNQLWFDRDFPGQDFVSCGDTNGNGSADVALLGQRPEDGQLQVMVQDAGTGERLAFVWF